jgi:hypothetical protein
MTAMNETSFQLRIRNQLWRSGIKTAEQLREALDNRTHLKNLGWKSRAFCEEVLKSEDPQRIAQLLPDDAKRSRSDQRIRTLLLQAEADGVPELQRLRTELIDVIVRGHEALNELDEMMRRIRVAV